MTPPAADDTGASGEIDSAGAGAALHRGGTLKLALSGPYLGGKTPSIRAVWMAARRERALALARMAEAWCSTVLGERKRWVATSALVLPGVIRARISASRGVGWAGLARVAGRGPRGMSRAPRSCSRR